MPMPMAVMCGSALAMSRAKSRCRSAANVRRHPGSAAAGSAGGALAGVDVAGGLTATSLIWAVYAPRNRRQPSATALVAAVGREPPAPIPGRARHERVGQAGRPAGIVPRLAALDRVDRPLVALPADRAPSAAVQGRGPVGVHLA